MDGIVPRDYDDPVRATRDTRKRLAYIQQQAIVRRDAIEAAAKEALQRVQANAELGRAEGLLNVKAGYDIAHYASSRSDGLDQAIANCTRDNPGLERIQRSFEDTAALVANMAIYKAGSGQ